MPPKKSHTKNTDLRSEGLESEDEGTMLTPCASSSRIGTTIMSNAIGSEDSECYQKYETMNECILYQI